MSKKQLKQTVIVNEKESDPGEGADKKTRSPGAARQEKCLKVTGRRPSP